jgi:hypothetical protein
LRTGKNSSLSYETFSIFSLCHTLLHSFKK